MSLLPQEAVLSCCNSPLTGAISTLPIWILGAAFSWLAPAVTASGIDREGGGSDVGSRANGGEEGEGEASIDRDGDRKTAVSENASNDASRTGKGHGAEEDERDEYNPMGLQMWANESSFLRALEGGRLLLVIILSPLCKGDMNVGIRKAASLAARGLDDNYLTLTSAGSTLPPVTKPLIGILDASVTETQGLIESFGSVTHYPAFKFVLTTPIANQKVKEGEVYDHYGNVRIWEFLAPRETAKDLYDSVLMYWYRFVVTNALHNRLDSGGDGGGEAANSPVFTFSSQLQLTEFLDGHGAHLFRPAQARRPRQSELESELFDFYIGQMNERSEVGGIFHPFEFPDEVGATSGSSRCDAPPEEGGDSGGEDDSASARNVPCDEDEEFTQEIDPFILLVQCRSKIVDYGSVELDGEGKKLTDDQLERMIRLETEQSARKEFDDLAEEMIHRRDVAFFALNATYAREDETTTTGFLGGKVCDGLFDEAEGSANGAAAFFRARRYLTYSLDAPVPSEGRGPHARTHGAWDRHRRRVIRNVRTVLDDVKLLHPHALFVPNPWAEVSDQQKEIHGKEAVKDLAVPTEYVRSKLVASTVVHTTPTVMWFDRDRTAQLAFPWYRKVHAVLFVDMALAHKDKRPPDSSHAPDRMWPSSLNRSSEVSELLVTQRRAIQMFYNAALRHRVDRPDEDVVFLIIPSSEVRIMTAFGVDIWTPLDEALFGTADEDGSNDEREPNPNSSADEGYCSNSDDGESRNILPVMMITDSSGRSGMQSSRYYLCSNDIFSSSPVKFSNGGAMGEFVDKFFTGTIGKPFIRSESISTAQANAAQDVDKQDMNKPNVTVVTGNTFENLVMDRDHVHTMLLMQSTSCGHCKRFSIFWNELASLVQGMNWNSVVNVMKIDVTKNDVPHAKINAWDLPSVYYFPAGEKSDPIEMTPVARENSNPQNDYDEGLSWVNSGYDLVKWMVNQGKLDLELLLRLENSSKNDDTSNEKNEVPS